MKLQLPTGSGIYYENVEGEFTSKPLNTNKGQNASQISLHWLNNMQQNFIKNGEISYIQSELTGQEKQIGSYHLDGFVVFDGCRIGLDFRIVIYHNFYLNIF